MTTPVMNPLHQRRAGVLLHPTSLPGPWVMGDLSHSAYRFVEFLADAGQTLWQVLPLGPTHNDLSPYQCQSTHAGNPLLISLDWLVERGWLPDDIWQYAKPDVDWRHRILQQGCDHALQSLDIKTRQAFDSFCQQQAYWLDDYAHYIALKQEQDGAPWWQWPSGLRRNDKGEVLRQTDASIIKRCKFEQYLFFTQWQELRSYAHERGVYLIGDLPIFVSADSADVWARRANFQVDDDGQSHVVAGVPPDAFSDEGQKWGNPLFNWEHHAENRFRWWRERLRTHFALYDVVRIDHFRGLEACWEIPSDAPDAKQGRWESAPGDALLSALAQDFSEMPLLAEDLGIITEAVDALRKKHGLPGMKVLQFAFDGDLSNTHLPHNHTPDTVVYTGTHDNDTTLSWYNSSGESTQDQLRRYLECADKQIPWALIRSAMMSPARTCITPMQDLLELGSEHRMNTPGTTSGNWRWRFDWSQLPEHLASRLHELTERYSRTQRI